MGLQLKNKCTRCRRLNFKLYLKSDKCFTDKCPLQNRRPISRVPPHRMSEYSKQLREKQRLRLMYAVTEKQFRHYYKRADRSTGVTGEELLSLLERRIDNVIYRLSWASSRIQGRQFVSHGHFVVNGRKAWTPSLLVKEGDVIEPTEKAKKNSEIKQNLQSSNRQSPPEWLKFDEESQKAVVVRLPEREELNQEIDVALIVEYYSRK